MAIISKLAGKAVVAENQKIEEKLKEILIQKELVQLAFKVVRDMVVLTNRRIIFVDIQEAYWEKEGIPINSIPFSYPLLSRKRRSYRHRF